VRVDFVVELFMAIILDLIFPKKCASCGQVGEYLCPKCQQNIPILSIKPPKSGFDGSLSFFKYNLAIKSLITDLKYNFVTDNADILVSIMVKELKDNFPNLLKYWRQNDFILIPIPLHLSRLNWRGFNQSELLSAKLAKKLKLKFSNHILLRHKSTHAQARLTKSIDRINNVVNIFSLNPISGNLNNKNFILFDDVTTTQSTLNSAQSALKILSPSQCWSLTLASG